MTSQTLGLLIGGLAPAVLFAVANVCTKAATQAGIGLGPYLLLIGLGVVSAGVVALFLFPDRALSAQSGSIAFVFGIAWGTGVACISYAIAQYGAPLSQLSPIFNANTLLTVLAALWIFAEWKQVQVPQLLLGSLLIIAGSALVARA